jgi:cytochrome c-type biogenesis protein CcmH/NrfG
MLRVMLSDAPIGFVVFFGGVAALIALGFVFTGYSLVRNRKALRRAGYDPTTAGVQMAAEFLQGRSRPLERRLAELDDLHARGLISDEEHAAARSTALASP